jgi:hypothetical protein
MISTSREFVAAVRSDVIDANLQYYQQMFTTGNAVMATDPYGKEALLFYASLDATGRQRLFKIIRQVMADTISSVLGILDGATNLGQGSGALVLELAGRSLSGTLQDEFLEMEEHESE